MIFATGNRHKLRELRELLPGVELEPLPEDVTLPPEEGDSFAEIALEKARATHEARTAGRRTVHLGACRPSHPPLMGRGSPAPQAPRKSAAFTSVMFADLVAYNTNKLKTQTCAPT